MLKKMILIPLFLLTLSPVAMSCQENQFLNENSFPKGYFLMPESLPHFMGVYRAGGKKKIKPSKEQATIIEERARMILQFIPPTAVKIRDLETEIVNDAVFRGKNFSELSAKISKVSALRLRMTKMQIDAITFLKKVLTPEQFKIMVELATKEDHSNHKH